MPDLTKTSAVGDSDLFAGQAGLKRTAVWQLVEMLREHKKWWLLPIVLVLLLFGVLLMLGATAAAPFIYTLF